MGILLIEAQLSFSTIAQMCLRSMMDPRISMDCPHVALNGTDLAFRKSRFKARNTDQIRRRPDQHQDTPIENSEP